MPLCRYDLHIGGICTLNTQTHPDTETVNNIVVQTTSKADSTYIQYNQIVQQNTYHFYLSGQIKDPIKYVDMIHTMKTAKTGDIVHIYLNSTGGQVATGVQLIIAMRFSSAHIICHIEGKVCSMASTIFLAADEFIVHDDIILMLHNTATGVQHGKVNEGILHISAIERWCTTAMREYYIPFISESEFGDMIRGTDIWLSAPEIKERLIIMVNLRNKQPKPKKQKSDVFSIKYA